MQFPTLQSDECKTGCATELNLLPYFSSHEQNACAAMNVSFKGHANNQMHHKL